MTIQEEMAVELKEAMRAKDQKRLNIVRAVKAELGRKLTEPGSDGEATDEVHLDVMASFVKKAKKSIDEYAAIGERGKEMHDSLVWEVEYLSRWLPSKLDEAATRALVSDALAATGATDASGTGRVMGFIMKDHKDEVDGGLVNRLVKEALSAAE